MFALDPLAALVFLPGAALIGLYISWTDLSGMRIPNGSVLALAGLFVVLGPLVLPLDIYGYRLLHLVVMLLFGMAATAAGAMGAGDSKFIAAAAPYVALPDSLFLMILFSGCLLAAVATHRLAKHSFLRRLAPDWQSWSRGREFPMGTALSTTLTLYLLLAAIG
ncbi:prepilin peptidase [Pseudooceanicola sp. C21-150M6]|uniref:prepilin peptidase n=1 Tax=Pseudooceanicola sp. C21-150M6 TaxID=3434355 RepID=UPI003D7F71D0